METMAVKKEIIDEKRNDDYSGIPQSLIDDFLRGVKAKEAYHLKFDSEGYVIIDDDTPEDVIDWLMEG
jgi:hypothetical protein